MDKTKKEELVKELSVKLKRYKAKAKLIKIDEEKLGDTMFVQQKAGTFLNPKYISVEDYFDIFAFESFLKVHEDLSTEQIEEILNEKYIDFKFLRTLNDSVGGMIENIRKHGAKSVSIMYVNNILYAKKDEGLEV